MLGSHLKIAIRNMSRHRTATMINIVGLALGIASCILIMIWVQFEASYDRFHQNLDDLYLLGGRTRHGADARVSRQTPPMAAPAVLEKCPAVLNSTRMKGYGERILTYEDQVFPQQIEMVDDGFFQMFSFRFLAGDPQTAFDDKNSIVLTRSVAEKFFGEQPALDGIMQLDYRHDLRVTGVVEDLPANSTLSFEALIPFEFKRSLPGNENCLSTWSNFSFSSYVQLHPGTDVEALNKVINRQAEPDNKEENLSLYVFPFGDLHLKSVSGIGGFIVVLIMYSVFAGLILLTACINFMNLATARAGGRAKEVGVRKVIGATRGELITQFYLESMLQAGLALALALVLVEQFLPVYRKYLYWADLRLDYFGNPTLLLGALGITLLTGLVAGSYPALLMSSFKPAKVLQGSLRIGARGGRLRRILVVWQFGTAVVLIILTSVVYKQIEYMRNKPLGHDVENILYFKMSEELRPHFDVLKTDLERQESIHAVTKSNRPLSGIYTNAHGWDWEGRNPQIDPLVTYLGVGLDYLEVYGIEMAEGRFFDESDLARGGTEVIVNKAFADMLGSGSALGRKLHHRGLGPDGYTIIGVTRDFHYKPVDRRIGPLLIEFNNQRSNNYVFIRIAGDDIPETLATIEKACRRILPDQIFDYEFAADHYEHLYRAMGKRGEILRVFAILAVLLSCLGLFGMASYMTEQRAKEISIRKVLGASVASVTLLLARDFVRWVIVANLIAWPVAFLLTGVFLQNFADGIRILWWIFIKAGALTVILALLTVSFRSIQAALADPVEAIRRE